MAGAAQRRDICSGKEGHRKIQQELVVKLGNRSFPPPHPMPTGGRVAQTDSTSEFQEGLFAPIGPCSCHRSESVVLSVFLDSLFGQ